MSSTVLPLIAAILVVTATRLLPASAQTAPPGAVEFTAHTIATGLKGGYQVVVADLNNDRKPDVIAVASAMPELVWYENPGWERHVIATGMSQMINAAAADLDGDGIPELALASGFTMSPKTSTGILSLLTHGPDATAPWTIQEIDRVPTAHRVRWIDADPNGRKMLVMAPLVGPDAVAPDYKAPVSIFLYRAPGWKREILADTFTGLVHGIEPVRWPGVVGQALLSAGFAGIHLHQYADGKWTPTELTKGDPAPWPKSGASDVVLGHLGPRPFIAAIEPWHGNQVVIYTLSKEGWERRVIDDAIVDGHTLIALDVDNDGREEVVAGQRGGARSLMLYSASTDGATWTRRVVDEGGMPGAGCAAVDVNGDTRTDIVCIGTATATLKWYENIGKR